MTPFPNHRRGGILVKLLLFALAAVLLLGILYRVLDRVRVDAACRDNLRRIYQALEQYELEKGALPVLAYYPDEPFVDADSLRVVLEGFGLPPDATLCPAGHPMVIDQGLSYIWNAAMNGANLTGGDEERRWLLVDVQAIAPDVPHPHIGGYHVLYSNGEIETVRNPREALPGL